MAAAPLKDWIDSRQAAGKYTFLRDEAVKESGLSQESVKKALQRLTRRRRIAKLKNYFYVIVPLEYLHVGSPPASWFIHHLMAAMGVPYYVALLSAAAQLGSSHHQPQEFQVMTDRSIRPLKIGHSKIHFFATKYLSAALTSDIKTPTGIMRVSSPETTVVDLVRFAGAAGHLDHVATVIKELSADLDSKRLVAAVRSVHDIPNAQRLGYLLDCMQLSRLANPIYNWIYRHNVHPVPLRPLNRGKTIRQNHRWRVLVDRPIEVEA
ncbi:MAG TPA: type IV toxin-antitoxin system AbiEi family antitoxin [Phycisphaerae bacterium]